MVSPRSIIAINRVYYRGNLGAYDRHVRALEKTTRYEAFGELLPAGARILDAGCGTGVDALGFTRLGFQVTAIDVSTEMVEHCRTRGIDARLGTIQGIKFKGSFDAVWANASLIHVPHSQIRATLRRLLAALRRGGFLYVTLWEGLGEGMLHDGRFVSLYGFSEFKGLLCFNGRSEIICSWRTPNRKAGSGPAWMGFLSMKQ